MLLIGSSSLFYLILHVANWILIICTASHFLIMAAGLCLPQSSMTLTTVCLPLPWSFMAFPPCDGISQTISLFKLNIFTFSLWWQTSWLPDRVKKPPLTQQLFFYNFVLWSCTILLSYCLVFWSNTILGFVLKKQISDVKENGNTCSQKHFYHFWISPRGRLLK